MIRLLRCAPFPVAIVICLGCNFEFTYGEVIWANLKNQVFVHEYGLFSAVTVLKHVYLMKIFQQFFSGVFVSSFAIVEMRFLTQCVTVYNKISCVELVANRQ